MVADSTVRDGVAVVTGGGTGIGRAVAELLAQTCRVVCVGIDADADLPESITFRKADVTSMQEVTKALADLDEIDYLVNCAGIVLHEGREFRPEGFQRVVDVNLSGSQILIEATRERLASRRGAVVNVASMWSYFGSKLNPGYAASKAGVVGLTRSYAVALAGLGVRVNAVAPGWIKTRLASGALENPERLAGIMSRLPLGRLGEPLDVARVVGFLCSPAAEYVTGVVLPVDGGFSIA